MLREPDYHGVLFTCTHRNSIFLYNESILRLLKLKDPSGDGDGLIRDAVSKDKYFLMGYIYIGTNLVFGRDSTGKYDKEIETHIETCESLIEKTTKNNNDPKITFAKNELLYFQALKSFYKGNLTGALSYWKEIILLNSFDILALWFLHFGFQSYGNVEGLYNSIACVINDWELLNKKRNNKLETIGFIYGMYGFGLNEIGDYYRAWKYSQLSLKYDITNVWATHGVAHILEETGQPVQGLKFLSENEKYWRHNQNYDSVSGIHHIEWHWGLYFIELGQYSNALNLFDECYCCLGNNKNKNKNKSIRNSVRLRDASSYLWRLELNSDDFINDTSKIMDNYNNIKYTSNELTNEIEYRWSLLYPFINDINNNRYIEVYHDSYYLINLIKQKEYNLARKYIDQLERLSISSQNDKNSKNSENGTNTYYVETCSSPNGCIDIFNGLYEGYVNDKFEKGFNLFYKSFESSFNNNFWRMAGSRAQKDIFQLTMIDLARKCENNDDTLCKLNGILNQRLENKILSPQTLNIMSKLYHNKNYIKYDVQLGNEYSKIRQKAMKQGYTMYQRPYHIDGLNLFAKIGTNSNDTSYFSKL